MAPNWDKLRKRYDPDAIKEFQILYNLRGGNRLEIKKQRAIVRNMGYMSLPFSMNAKKA